MKVHLLAVRVTVTNMFPHRALGAVLILELVKSLDELGVEIHLVEQHWQVSVGEELLLQLLPCFYQTFFDIPPFSLHNQVIFLSWTSNFSNPFS